MVKNAKILEELNRQEIKKQKFSYSCALKLFESMWREAVALGVLPFRNPMEGIETDIKVAQILNSCLNN